MHIAPGSKRTYSDHWRQLEAYCDTFGLDPLRLDEQALSKAVLYFALGHSVNSVPSHLSALQKVYTFSDAGDLPRSPVFKMFQAGVQRLFGAADKVVQIKAIQFAEMVTILDSLSWDDPTDVCFNLELKCSQLSSWRCAQRITLEAVSVGATSSPRPTTCK
jgi:hypothetical protein